jgi:Kef-type K+ transport system membrane component KefB
MEHLWLNTSTWLFLAIISSFISIRLGISVALIELIVGVIAGNTIHPEISEWVTFLASFGAIFLTFLAGAEIESSVVKKYWKESLTLGVLGFVCPFLLCLAIAHFMLGWDIRASCIAGLALSTTSVAVVYAVMLETGFNEKPIGKLILAACFVNDLGTVIALGLIFANFNMWFWIFIGITLASLYILPKLTPLYIYLRKFVNGHVSEPGIKGISLILTLLAYFAVMGKSEGVLPAYLIGMVLADTFAQHKGMIKKMRIMTFTFLTPFYFLKAGSLVDMKVVLPVAGIVILFFFGKVIAKFSGLYPAGMIFKFKPRLNIYINLLMSTGLTFGSISALYGLTNNIISKQQYSILIVVVILTAIIPTLIAQKFFLPETPVKEQLLTQSEVICVAEN